MKGYRTILEAYIAGYYPVTALTSLDGYRKIDAVKIEEIRSKMYKLTPSGFNDQEAWRLAWHSLSQQRYHAAKK